MALNFNKHNPEWRPSDLNQFEDSQKDEAIHQAVVEGLYKSSLNTESIRVTVTQGQVYLRGLIDNFDDFIKIEEFIIHIKGVQGIQNELQVRS